MGMVILEVGAGGTPPPAIFWAKNAIFLHLSHISPQIEVIGPQKFGGSVPPPLGAPSPLKFFSRSRLGLTRCFHLHFAMVGLDVIGVEFRRRWNFGGDQKTLACDSDHAKCQLGSSNGIKLAVTMPKVFLRTWIDSIKQNWKAVLVAAVVVSCPMKLSFDAVWNVDVAALACPQTSRHTTWPARRLETHHEVTCRPHQITAAGSFRRHSCNVANCHESAAQPTASCSR